MVAIVANAVIALFLLGAAVAFVRAGRHEFSKVGTLDGLLGYGLPFTLMIGMTAVVVLVRDALT